MRRLLTLSSVLAVCAAVAIGCSSTSDVALEKSAAPAPTDASAPPMQNVDMSHRGLSFRPGGSPATGGGADKVKG